ncbi:MAG: hypothetical protein CMQ40_10750 [Gammaproteobacteria bacterium]|nr:hypothetical protein [Gammaproteobacteria bacterium]
MKKNFKPSLKLTLAHEGGFVNHPKDPGGATNYGIIQRTYDKYRDDEGLPRRSVKLITIKEREDIYKARYWDLIKGDELPTGVDYAVFDYAVNSGPGRAAKELQRVVGAGVDGSIGPATLEAVRKKCEEDGVESIIYELCERRMRFLRSLKTFSTFGRGWTRRVLGSEEGAQENDHGVLDVALVMAREDLNAKQVEQLKAAPVGTREGENPETPLVKALPSDQSVAKTKSGVGQIIAATGVTGQVVMGAADKVSPRIDDTPIGMIAFAVFILLIVGGVALTLWSLREKIRERNGENETPISNSLNGQKSG